MADAAPMPVMESPPGATTIFDGRRYLYFGGTGYLGLQGHRAVSRAAAAGMRRYGIGSATTRAGFGATPPVLEVERLAADWLGGRAALYFAGGYPAAQVLLAALDGEFDVVLLDELSHYCLHEAARLTGRRTVVFRHRDPDDLRRRLGKALPRGGRPLVLSDGVFAGLGRIAPADAYRSVLAEFPGSILCLDDAHAFGVLGRSGRGTYEHLGSARALGVPRGVNDLAPDGTSHRGDAPRLFCVGTLSKAVGGYGGIVPGTPRLIQAVRRRSHCFNGSSPTPVPIAAATAKALEIVMREPARRRRLWDNVDRVKSGLRELGLPVDGTPVPILGLSLGTASAMRSLHKALKNRGILVPYLADYAGLGPHGGLRLAVFATHTPAMIERLLDEFRRVI